MPVAIDGVTGSWLRRAAGVMTSKFAIKVTFCARAFAANGYVVCCEKAAATFGIAIVVNTSGQVAVYHASSTGSTYLGIAKGTVTPYMPTTVILFFNGASLVQAEVAANFKLYQDGVDLVVGSGDVFNIASGDTAPATGIANGFAVGNRLSGGGDRPLNGVVSKFEAWTDSISGLSTFTPADALSITPDYSYTCSASEAGGVLAGGAAYSAAEYLLPRTNLLVEPTGLQLSGTAVTSWNDSSGLGCHLANKSGTVVQGTLRGNHAAFSDDNAVGYLYTGAATPHTKSRDFAAVGVWDGRCATISQGLFVFGYDGTNPDLRLSVNGQNSPFVWDGIPSGTKPSTPFPDLVQPASPAVIGIRANAAGLTIWINNRRQDIAFGAGNDITNFSAARTVRIGHNGYEASGGHPYYGKLRELHAGGACTDTEMAAAMQLLATKHGVALEPTFAVTGLASSSGAGFYGKRAETFISGLDSLLTQYGGVAYNFAASGETVAAIDGSSYRASTFEADRVLDSAPRHLAIVWAGSNDIKLGATAETTLGNLGSLAGHLKAAGYEGVVYVTALPRTDLSTTQENEDMYAQIVELNDGAAAIPDIDRVVRIDQLPQFVPAGGTEAEIEVITRGTHYRQAPNQDETHLRESGHALVNPPITAAMAAELLDLFGEVGDRSPAMGIKMGMGL